MKKFLKITLYYGKGDMAKSCLYPFLGGNFGHLNLPQKSNNMMVKTRTQQPLHLALPLTGGKTWGK